MKCQIAPFDIGIIAIALVIFAVISIFLLENLHIFTKTVVVEVVYDTNEAYRLLVSLLSLNYSSYTAYEIISSIDYIDDQNFANFLNSSLYHYFEKAQKCYKLSLDSKVLVEYKSETYSGDCTNTRFNAVVPIFVPYNKAKLVEELYLNYER
jgi:hypothetical protein